MKKAIVTIVAVAIVAVGVAGLGHNTKVAELMPPTSIATSSTTV